MHDVHISTTQMPCTGTQETSTGSATEASKDVRRHNLTLEEENAIRYASGYVMMKRFDSKGMMDISECLTL
jgi:hypothetical protein